MALNVTIISGERVPYRCVMLVSESFTNLFANPKATAELMKKCEDANYQWAENAAKSSLQLLGLVQSNGTVEENVKRVLLCSVTCFSKTTERGKDWVKIVNPMNGSHFGIVDYSE
jgi:hypothetical protein